LHAWRESSTHHATYTFAVGSHGADPLFEGDVAPTDLSEAHARWRNSVRSAVWSVLGVTLLLCAGPLLELRRRTRDLRPFVVLTGGLVLATLIVRLVFSAAIRPLVGPRTLTSPLDLMLDALLVAMLTWLTLEVMERRRVSRPRPHLLTATTWSLFWVMLAYAAAGAADAALLYGYERFLQRVVSPGAVHLFFSLLHPGHAPRVAVGAGAAHADGDRLRG